MIRKSEFELIEELTRNFEQKNNFLRTIAGIGDDAAVLEYNETHYLLITTDYLAEGIHFDPVYTPLPHLGFKTVAVNLSDIYAMNGIPVAITTSVAVSNRYDEEHLTGLYSGIKAACNSYNVNLIGGDTGTAQKGMFLSVTAIGIVEKERLVLRSKAKVNDLICVSGDLGAAYAGLQVLEREKRVFLENPSIQPDLNDYPYVVKRLLKPSARKDIMEYFLLNDILPNAMIDISDGLINDLLHICKQSEVGAYLYADRLPIDPETIRVADEFDVPFMTFALYGGEDYELLFTMKPQLYDLIKHDKDKITVIGHTIREPGKIYLETTDGQVLEPEPLGWDHFGKS